MVQEGTPLKCRKAESDKGRCRRGCVWEGKLGGGVYLGSEVDG